MKTTVEIRFGAHRVPGGAAAILGPTQCGPELTQTVVYKALQQIDVTITLDENDERIRKVLSLLAEYGEEPWVERHDTYTEDELQTARLLVVSDWGNITARGGPDMGTSYDMTNACSWCGTGARQSSAMIVDNDDVRTMSKHRIGSTSSGDLLLRDEDVERLIAANVTGALFWPASAKTKSGNLIELRYQQAYTEHVMPPLGPSSLLNREGECTTCHRGGMTRTFCEPLRFFYRAQDVLDAQDFNVTWEWMGPIRQFNGNVSDALFPSPYTLVTPKVMNLLRGKTKKEQKYQGCDFIPIWIEDDKHEKPYLQT